MLLPKSKILMESSLHNGLSLRMAAGDSFRYFPPITHPNTEKLRIKSFFCDILYLEG